MPKWFWISALSLGSFHQRTDFPASSRLRKSKSSKTGSEETSKSGRSSRTRRKPSSSRCACTATSPLHSKQSSCAGSARANGWKCCVIGPSVELGFFCYSTGHLQWSKNLPKPQNNLLSLGQTQPRCNLTSHWLLHSLSRAILIGYRDSFPSSYKLDNSVVVVYLTCWGWSTQSLCRTNVHRKLVLLPF